MALDLFGLKPAPRPAPAGAAAGDIIDATDANFMAEVIEESKKRPVVVDLWAEWCGPCRQLGPSLEKHVAAQKGKVRLAKVDVDKNPMISQQFKVQSIPAVFVIDQGKAFQGFTGALPDSQVKAFIEELASGIPGGEGEAGGGIEDVLAFAAEALAAGDTATAAQAYAQALQIEPENVKAVAGLARCYLAMGETERAEEVAKMAPETANDPDLVSVRAQLKLAAGAKGAAAEDQPLRDRLAADPADHEARFELAKGLSARGDLEGAAEELFALIGRERDWNEGAARKELLTVFEAAGPMSELAKSGRRRLSSLLFA